MQQDYKNTKDSRKRTKLSITPQQLIELGKIPPQAVDLEMAVLGAFMLDGDCLTNIIDILKPEVFYKEAHQRIFSAMEDLFNDAEPVDILTVSQKLKKKGELEIAGGAVYVTQLTNRIASSANCEFHARIVIEKFIQRELIRISTNTLQHSYEDTSDVFDLLHLAEENIFSISHTTIKKTYEHIRAVISKSLNEIESARNKEFNGVQSGFTTLDRITGGWQRSDLIVIAARPGMGKTAFAMTVARNAGVDFKKPIAIFSLEMPATQLVNRLIAAEAEIDSDRLRKGEISEGEWQKIHEKIGRLAEAPIFIDDTPALSVFEFRAKAKRLKRQYGIAAIIVDYLQLMTQGDEAKFGTREQEVSKIAKVLKATAKELDIPIIALSQLSRSVEQRTDRRPQLSDLRECLSVETSSIYVNNKFQSNSNSRMNLLSLSKENKLISMNSENIPKKKNKVFRLKLNSGRFIDCTANHKILTSDGYKPLKSITKEDSIACALNWTSEGNYISESRFIGWMLGNGSMSGYHSPEFITNDQTVANDFLEFINKRFGFYPKVHKHWSKEVFQYTMTKSDVRTPEGNPITKWLKEKDLWGNRSHEKYIPQWFLDQADQKSIQELLQGLYETDGSIAMHKSGRCVIKYATTSYFLAQQIIYLLAKIGIFAFIDNGHLSDKANYKCYGILINSGEFQETFRKKIKLRGYKGDKLKSITISQRGSFYGNKIGRNTTVRMHNELRENGFTKRMIQIHGNRRLAKNSLKGIFKNDACALILKKHEWLLSENIYWDGIENISEMGKVEIFDRSVPSTNNFVVNGVIVHNSGAIEQEADVVMFIYRPFISGVTQDENGQSTEGMAEAIIAKHRNGRIDSSDLMFVEQYAKFQDVSGSTYGFGNSAYSGTNQSKGNNPDENRIVEKMEPNRDFLKQGPINPDQYDGNIDPATGF